MPFHDRFADDRALITALSAAALGSAAPGELAALDATAAEYFADPGALLTKPDGPVAPFVLSVATPVVRFLVDAVSAAAPDAARPAVMLQVRRMIRPGPAPLSAEQARRARAIAYDQAGRLGLPEPDRARLADSVAGGLVSPPRGHD